MLTKNMTRFVEVSDGMNAEAVMPHVRPSLWQMVACASVAAGIGSGYRIVTHQAALPSPFLAAITMMLATFAGWYVWGFFTYLTDHVLFGGQSDYRQTLNAFGRAYIFQALFFFAFTNPLGWLWGWIALYSTVAAWGVFGPRHLGMRSWKAVVSATLGMLVWLACLLVLTLALTADGQYIGVGVFLI